MRFLTPHIFVVLLAGMFGHAFGQDLDSSITQRMNHAYSVMATNPAEATRLFSEVVAREPQNVAALRELGYLTLSAGEHETALSWFEASERILPSDTIKLQMAYILATQRNDEEAKALFRTLLDSRDKNISRKADVELDALTSKPEPSRSWVRLYADPYYDSRWKSTFIHVSMQDGYDLTEDRKLSLYATLSLSTDTKSSIGLVPTVISDNTLLLGVGVRAKPFYGLSLIVQEGFVSYLLQRSTRSGVSNDFRAVMTYGNGLYPGFSIHDDARFPFTPLADLYSSFGYYSRYKNGIGYIQTKAGARVLEVSHTAMDLYVRGDYVFDTQKEFYNNIVEGGGGARLIPWAGFGLELVAEFHRGRYLNVSNQAVLQRASLYEQYYSSWRTMLIFEHTF